MNRRVPVVLALALLFALHGGGAEAQASGGLETIPAQGLAFGSLLPGVAETVAVGDGARRAEVVLTGDGWIDISFMLPGAMVSPSGARIPLQFGARDGALLRNSSSGAIPLNPLETSRIKLNPNQEARLLLGGTALPAQDQPAGRYTATIVIVASTPGT